MQRGRRLAAAIAVGVVAVTLGLTGCGNSGSSDVASLDGSGQAAGSGDDAARADPEQAMLEFARCMRKQGVEMPDPGPGGEFQLGGTDVDPEKLREAQKACGGLVGGPAGGALDVTGEQQAALQDASVAMARCFREHGIDMPDPTFGNGGGILMRPGDVDPSSAKFRKAAQACEPIMREAARKAGLQPSGPGS